MNETETNKQVLRGLIQTVWVGGDLNALPGFWTADCVNHAMPGADNRGLAALHTYHEQFLLAFAAFSDVQITVAQQVAEADRVVTQVVTRGRHTGEFFGLAPTGKNVLLEAMRIDRFQQGKIAEHWSVSDMAGLMQQLQS